jgi:hypothetical protein
MAERPILSVRLDPETIERLNDAAEERGHTASSLALHLIKQGVGAKPALAKRESAVTHQSKAEAVGGPQPRAPRHRSPLPRQGVIDGHAAVVDVGGGSIRRKTDADPQLTMVSLSAKCKMALQNCKTGPRRD